MILIHTIGDVQSSISYGFFYAHSHEKDAEMKCKGYFRVYHIYADEKG
jgi:hypothetical protein